LLAHFHADYLSLIDPAFLGSQGIQLGSYAVNKSLQSLNRFFIVKPRIDPTVLFCVLTVIAVLSTSVSAGTWECGERSNLPPEGKNYCAAGDFRQAQNKLEKLFGDLLKQHKERFGDGDSLASAQNAFKSYRDNQCTAENQRIEEKAYHPMIVAQCKTRLTNLRIDELNRMLKK